MNAPRVVVQAVSDQLAVDGLAVVPLLTGEDIAQLREVFDALHLAPTAPLTNTVSGCDGGERDATSDAILAIVRPRLAELMEGYDAVGAAFLAKVPGHDGIMTVHQDFSMVDEHRSHSLNLWCALEDTSPRNGGLVVVRGSHLWAHGPRSPLVPSAQLQLDGPIAPLLEDLVVPAGHAALYDHRLLHGSTVNGTDQVRVIAQIGLVPASETILMAVPDGEGTQLHPVPATAFFGPDGTPDWPRSVATGSAVPSPEAGAPTAEQLEARAADVLAARTPAPWHQRLRARFAAR